MLISTCFFWCSACWCGVSSAVLDSTDARLPFWPGIGTCVGTTATKHNPLLLDRSLSCTLLQDVATFFLISMIRSCCKILHRLPCLTHQSPKNLSIRTIWGKPFSQRRCSSGSTWRSASWAPGDVNGNAYRPYRTSRCFFRFRLVNVSSDPHVNGPGAPHSFAPIDKYTTSDLPGEGIFHHRLVARITTFKRKKFIRCEALNMAISFSSVANPPLLAEKKNTLLSVCRTICHRSLLDNN